MCPRVVPCPTTPRFLPRAAFLARAAPDARPRRFFQTAFDYLSQCSTRHGLVEHARKFTLVQIARVVPSHDHDRDVAGLRVGAQLALQVAARETDEREIQDDEGRHVLFEPPERVKPIFDGDDRIACVPQRCFVELAKRLIVFNDQ